MPVTISDRMAEIIRAWFIYSFHDTGFEYDDLTEAEKEICDRQEFEALVRWVHGEK